MDNKDLIEADYWESMVDIRKADNKSLRDRFEGFSLRANQMLRRQWKDYDDDRMKEIIDILDDVIRQKLYEVV